MQTPIPAPVSKWHRTTYPAINPSQMQLLMSRKRIAITGGDVGIGREMTRAFAAAGATVVHILGRTDRTLQETKRLVSLEFPSIDITTHACDVTDEKSVERAAQEIGAQDVLIVNAGFLSESRPITDSNLQEWWQSFETNVKGSFLVTKHFLPQRSEGAAIVGISSAVTALPATAAPNSSAYASSKFAVIKLFEYIAEENPDLHVLTIHPGLIETDMAKKGRPPGVPFDDRNIVKLPAHFTVWAASSDAKLARGKFLWCNWDVDELVKKLEEKRDDPFYLTSVRFGSY
ncbi:NAD(P)-binding protein [Penicillium canescens]|nr:NAD(P)-binding protein [Penicillium canescens]KAJ6172897.1 NAD(P)-binding protein [Penicillium canescens]